MSSDALHADRRGLGEWLRQPLTWAILGVLLLGGFIYYPLFFPESRSSLALQGEQFFFEANEAAGAPVLVLALWLFYRRSHYLDLLQRPGAPRAAAAVLALTLFVHAWGVYTSALDLQLASIIGLLFGAALLMGGRLAARAFWLPILFLAFALPISPVLLSAILYPVQLATAQYAGLVLNAIGVDSFVQGDQILRPENTFVVIETCSGLRTVVTLTMLTILLIDLFDRRGRHALLLILLAPIVAFLTNGLRVVSLVLNPYSDVMSIHNLQGIAMLLFGLTIIYLVDLLLERWIAVPADDGARDELEVIGDDGVSPRASARRVSIVLGVLVAMFGVRELTEPWTHEHYVDEKAGDLLVRVFDEWPSQRIEPDYNFLGSVRFLTWEHRRVRVDGRRVDVFLGVADEQRREQTILTPRLAWPASGYAVVEDERRSIDALGSSAGDADQSVRRMILRRGAKSVLSYSWYARSGSLIEEWFRQAAALDRSPFVRPKRILAVRISTPLGIQDRGLEDGEARIRRVYERLAPALADFAPTRAPADGTGAGAAVQMPAAGR